LRPNGLEISCGICNILLLPLELDSLDLAEGSLLLRLCYSVDIGQASELRLRFEPFLSHHFFIIENENLIAILSCNAACCFSDVAID